MRSAAPFSAWTVTSSTRVGGGVALGERDADAVRCQVAAVELPRVVDEGVVAALAHLLEDPPDDGGLLRVLGRVPGRALAQDVRELRACVDDLEGHRTTSVRDAGGAI